MDDLEHGISLLIHDSETADLRWATADRICAELQPYMMATTAQELCTAVIGFAGGTATAGAVLGCLDAFLAACGPHSGALQATAAHTSRLQQQAASGGHAGIGKPKSILGKTVADALTQIGRIDSKVARFRAVLRLLAAGGVLTGWDGSVPADAQRRTTTVYVNSVACTLDSIWRKI